MRFCDNCGSYLKETAKGLQCPRCGKLVPSEPSVVPTRESPKNKNSSDIYVVEKPPDRRSKVAQPCPKCGSREAFRWVSSISGEHAGIRRERTVEHFQCTKCLYTWAKSS